MDIEKRILDFLSSHSDAVRTIEIAKHIAGESGRRKTVNPTLYGMEKKGLIRKIAEENGANPKWILTDVSS